MRQKKRVRELAGVIQIRVKQEQAERWRKAAQGDDRDLSNWIRRVLDKASEMAGAQ